MGGAGMESANVNVVDAWLLPPNFAACTETSMQIIPALLRGSSAGVVGSLVQAAVGASESALILPDHEDANIAPRLMDRLARDVGEEMPLEAEWLLGTLFHFGYGATWGVLYALLDERVDVHPAVGGTALGAVIYALTFPRWGVAVQTQVERPPRQRTRRMSLVAASVALTFGLTTAYTANALKLRALAREST